MNGNCGIDKRLIGNSGGVLTLCSETDFQLVFFESLSTQKFNPPILTKYEYPNPN